jgi:3-deoxy-D-manno-octulosonate 8-phosphate phosphatase (KDO 8-P phosphatase)
MQTAGQKAKAIRLLILDVDGILTSGHLYYGNADTEIRGFHIHDGLGMKLLQKAGIAIAIISGKKSPSVIKRLEDLRIEHTYLGYENKLPAYTDIKQKLQLQDEEIAYMGDDLPDLPLLRRVGLAITVPQAPEIIKQHTDLITENKGGNGAVREVCEFLLRTQDRYESMIQSYLL